VTSFEANTKFWQSSSSKATKHQASILLLEEKRSAFITKKLIMPLLLSMCGFNVRGLENFRLEKKLLSDSKKT